jgi:hypothetical protein
MVILEPLLSPYPALAVTHGTDACVFISLIQKKSDTTQFLWVTIGPTYKLTTDKLSVLYALFTYVSICSL